MLPRSSKIKGYKGVITYGQKKGQKKMKYGYARVSTRQQDLEGQLRQLEEERCDRVYFEKITGTKSDRPEFQKLLQEIETGDTLVVTKLDRFARSTQDALNTIEYCEQIEPPVRMIEPASAINRATQCERESH